ncbi:MAG: hypothetical protein HC909_03225 [Blastochloris sp.]|nr:hypothetical protein [Blastochloris sp.]
MTLTFKGRPETNAGSWPTPWISNPVFGKRNAVLINRIGTVSSPKATRGAGPVTLIAV